MSAGPQSYINIDDHGHVRGEDIPWYWRLIALAASWMIVGGYLLLPGLYARDPQLRFSQDVLSVFIVALLTAGYSFTALLCFACRNERFQAERVFLPALTSSALGLLSIAYNFAASRSYVWATAAITGVVISTTATLVYAGLLLWKHRRVAQPKDQPRPHENSWSEQPFYTNFVQNMYPTVVRSPPHVHQSPTEDDRVNQQMALLRMTDSRPSPDANSSTFRIDLPEDTEEEEQFELVGTPPSSRAEWNRHRANSRPDSLGEQQAWDQLQERGRTAQRPVSPGARSNHSRGLSREERRREIELGHI